MRISPRAATVAALAAMLAFAACKSDEPNLAFQIAFASRALGSRAAMIEARIVKGGCASEDIAYVSAFTPGAAGTSPPKLDHGNYGFIARAQDGNCYWYAGGCTEVTVPRRSGAVMVELDNLRVETLDCDGNTCTSAACQPPPDAGLDADMPIDESPVMPPEDSGPPDDEDAGAPIDAGMPMDAAPLPDPVQISLEIEQGNPISAPFTVMQDEFASGGAYCTYPDDPALTLQEQQALKRSTPPADDTAGGLAYLEFDVPRTADYRMWGRVITPSLDDDSFWIRIDDGEWIQWNDISHQDQTWHWDDMRPFEMRAGLYMLPLSEGRHVLRVSYREMGAKIDRVVFASDLGFVPTD